MDSVGVDSDCSSRHVFCVLFDDFGGDGDDMLALPVFDEVELLEGTDDVFHFDRGHFAGRGEGKGEEGGGGEKKEKQSNSNVYKKKKKKKNLISLILIFPLCFLKISIKTSVQ